MVFSLIILLGGTFCVHNVLYGVFDEFYVSFCYKCCELQVLENLEALKSCDEYFKFHWYPHTGYAKVYHVNRTSEVGILNNFKSNVGTVISLFSRSKDSTFGYQCAAFSVRGPILIRSIQVSRKLPTYPIPNPTFCPK